MIKNSCPFLNKCLNYYQFGQATNKNILPYRNDTTTCVSNADSLSAKDLIIVAIYLDMNDTCKSFLFSTTRKWKDRKPSISWTTRFTRVFHTNQDELKARLARFWQSDTKDSYATNTSLTPQKQLNQAHNGKNKNANEKEAFHFITIPTKGEIITFSCFPSQEFKSNMCYLFSFYESWIATLPMRRKIVCKLLHRVYLWGPIPLNMGATSICKEK